MRITATLLALLLPATALAVPTELHHQGRLFNASGVPLAGSHDLTFTVWDAASTGTSLYTETISLNLDNGYYATSLGLAGSVDIDEALFDGNLLYMGIAVDGGAELPNRARISSVPYAVRANVTTDLDGGVVNATEIQVNGTTVIDSSGSLATDVAWSDITGAPQTLGDTASCSDGQLLTWQTSAWACADFVVDGSQVSTGTISVDRLPVGGSSTDVAAGDHDHAFGQLTGMVSFTQLPTGTASDEVAIGSHTHTVDFADLTGAAAFGQLPTGTSGTQVAIGNHSHSLPNDIDVSGGVTAGGRVTIGDDGATCDSSAAGSLRYDSTNGTLEFCDGTAWNVLSGGLGTDSNPGDSCKDILDSGASTGDGFYWIDPAGSGAFEVYCDMTTDGGGWTRFWWYESGAGMSGVTDVLAGETSDCDPRDARCMARMPVTNPTELHVRNHRNQWATWSFTGGSTSNKAFNAFTLRTETPYASACSAGDAWNAARNSGGFNDDPYRCDEGTGGAADNCDCFWYGDYSGVNSFYLDDDSGWAETAFGAGRDNNNALGVDSLESTGGALTHSVSHSLWMYYR